MSESFADLFEESLKTIDMKPGSIVTGIVVDVDDDWVTVHAGLKSEGVIPKDQFFNDAGECNINIGDNDAESVDEAISKRNPGIKSVRINNLIDDHNII